MGKSKSIEEKMKDDKKFRDFMHQVEKESDEELERIKTSVNNTVKRHYDGNGWDYARFFGDSRSDYQNYDEWSLGRIMKIVDAIGGALEDMNYPSSLVPGSEKADPSTIDEAKEFAQAFTGDYSLVISRVKAMVNAVLSQFSTVSEAHMNAELRDMPLSGGLHMFFGSTGETYRNEAFFSKQFIGSFQIVFEVYMSVDEARMIGIQQILATTQVELAFINAQIILVRKQQAKSLNEILKNDPEDYVSTKATYELIVDSLKADRDRVMLEYDKYNDVIEAVETHFSEIDFSGVTGFMASQDRPLKLKNLFNEWELKVAERYIQEKYA